MSERRKLFGPVPEGNDLTAQERSEVRSAVLRFLAMGLIVLVVIAVPVTLWVRGIAATHALRTSTFLTERLAEITLTSLVTRDVIEGNRAALDRIDRRIAPAMNEGSIIRVKVWDSNGLVLYSDARELIGTNTGLPPLAQKALSGAGSQATIETQVEPDDETATGDKRVLEVYVLTETASGDPLVFEAYFDDSIITEEQAAVFLGILPAFILSLAALQLAQLVPAIQLARRIQGHQIARRELIQQAAEASELERRRVARMLHDDVIQDLAGLAYAVDAEERGGDAAHKPFMHRAWSILQENIRRLRITTDELYPPDLRAAALADALALIAQRISHQGVDVQIDVAKDLELDDSRSTLLYRVSREVLTNALKHAGAAHVRLALTQSDTETLLRIDDDGRGFDSEAPVPDGHFGIRIIKDTIRVAGGQVDVTSGLGTGTSVVVRFPREDAAVTR